MGRGDSGNPVTLHFAGALALRNVCERALTACRALQVPQPGEARLAVVIEELLANLFDHGGLSGVATIELSMHREGEGVAIMLADNGRAFDPRGPGAPSTVPKRGGGAGLALVRRWATVRSYEPGPPINRLRLFVPTDGKQ